MADYYCESSSFLKIPAEKLDKAKEILDLLKAQASEEMGYPGYCYEVDGDGVCIYSSYGDFNPDDAEIAARRLVEELGIDEPFVCSWSYTCSKPRIDAFGGGAFVVKRGYKTLWLDVQSLAKDAVEQNLLEKLDEVGSASN
jgi:hypothetical protein